MRVLAIDVGSSSVKAAVLVGSRVCGRIARVPLCSRFENGRAEVDAPAILAAVSRAAGQLDFACPPEVISLAGMAPSWVAMDGRGHALTPIVTHQDRRSLEEAREFVREFGERRLLSVTGNLPFPGGISCTTSRWFKRHAPAILRRAELVGHVTTWLHRQLTGVRVIDPSNASFTGIYHTLSLEGWNRELARFAGLDLSQLPEIRDGAAEAGRLLPGGGRLLGLPAGTPVLTGVMDTSAALLAVGARPGQLVNASGTTDVLALCVSSPRPHPQLLTRALGTGRLWLQVNTIASAGSTLQWLHAALFADLSELAFYRLVLRLSQQPPALADVRFEPFLAGDRMRLEQKQGTFIGLTLATTREQMLYAALAALAKASAARLPLLCRGGTRPLRDVLISGGANRALARILRRDWQGHWRFREIREANLRGLAALASLKK